MNKIQTDDPKKILLVDDEEIIRSIFELALIQTGHIGCYAQSGEEALEILRREDEINVIFLDLNLPDMSGVELCSYIRSARPQAVINALTGYAPFFDITECYHAGFDDYLEKPISSERLFTSIYKAMESTKTP